MLAVLLNPKNIVCIPCQNNQLKCFMVNFDNIFSLMSLAYI